MKHSFIDKYSHLDSHLHKIDPRVKLIAVFSSIVIIVSEPPGEFYSFLFYGMIIFGLVLISRIPLRYVLSRCLIVSPFIIIAALLYPVSSMIIKDNPPGQSYNQEYIMALTILLKAFMSVILLILLTSTERFHNLLLGLRKLKMPKLLGIISALMYRYVFIITDEAMRTTRARESRTPGRLNINRFKVYGNQSAMIFLRSLERSQIIYNSMLSRGFKGDFPVMQKLILKRKDVIFASLFILIVLAVRLTNQGIHCYLFY